MVYVLRGIVLGFSIAAPVGPIGVLCIRRTLVYGRGVGFVSGLGAATADAFYGGIAAFGLTIVSSVLLQQRLWIHLIGALFLAYLGLRTLRAQPAEATSATPTPTLAQATSLVRAYTSTLLLTLTNPLTILSFVTIFAGLGVIGAHSGVAAPALTTLGVFCGSALWWLILSVSVSLLRARFSSRALRWVNVFAGILLLAFALAATLSAR